MKRMKLRLLKEDAQVAATVLAKLSVLHLDSIDPSKSASINEFPAAEFESIHHRIQVRFKKIMAFCKKSIEVNEKKYVNPVTRQQLLDVDERLKSLWIKVSEQEEKQRKYKEQTNANMQLQVSLQRFISLNVDLSRFGRGSQFLNLLIGTVPGSNIIRLKSALSIMGYLLHRFYAGEGVEYVIIVGSSGHAEDADELLQSADYRALSLPAEFGDEPQLVNRQLQQHKAQLEALLLQSEKTLDSLIVEQKKLLATVPHLLKLTSPYAGIGSYLKGKGGLVLLEGWVPVSRTSEIQKKLTDHLEYAFQIQFETPNTDEVEQVPTLLKQSKFVKPFQVLVSQYGLPQYGEYDPGVLFAVSYTLMFGMMFGDVGHGVVIIALSLLFRTKLRSIGLIGSMAGLSSVAFGFVYGSIFGYEHILHPLWMSPMHNPQQVLLLALYWGMGFLIIANLLALRNLFVMHKVKQALYSPLGLAGLLFYLVAVASLIALFGEPSLVPKWSAPILFTLMVAMLYYLWQQSSGSFFERILVVLIEGLEFLISNISATLSFLRVGAFALNHVALAAAVFSIAAMLDVVGHGVSIILGNLFIIVLEGAIVAIQCLRLEYYEGFSRFFSGGGRPYKPLKMSYF